MATAPYASSHVIVPNRPGNSRKANGEEMTLISANGLNLWYERRGEGAKVLVLTGTGGDLRKGPSILASPLADRFEVATYDQRGLGRSDKPPGPYSMADYAEDARGVLDALGWDTAHIVGISFGGMVAQELAIRHPDRIDRLVLCCTTPGGAGGSSYPQHLLHHLTPEEKVLHMLPVADCRRDQAWQAANPTIVADLVRAAVEDPYIDEPGAREGRRAQIDARGTHDAWDRLHQIAAPTLVCGARYDRQAAPEAVEALASRISGASLRMFEGGHMFLGQDLAALPAIIDFLAVADSEAQPAMNSGGALCD